MKTAKYFAVLSFALALGFVLFASAHPQDAFVGRWVLDPASTKAAPGLAPTAATMEVTAAGGGKYQSISEVAMGEVNARSEVTFSVDGQDYVVRRRRPCSPALRR